MIFSELAYLGARSVRIGREAHHHERWFTMRFSTEPCGFSGPCWGHKPSPAEKTSLKPWHWRCIDQTNPNSWTAWEAQKIACLIWIQFDRRFTFLIPNHVLHTFFLLNSLFFGWWNGLIHHYRIVAQKSGSRPRRRRKECILYLRHKCSQIFLQMYLKTLRQAISMAGLKTEGGWWC